MGVTFANASPPDSLEWPPSNFSPVLFRHADSSQGQSGACIRASVFAATSLRWKSKLRCCPPPPPSPLLILYPGTVLTKKKPEFSCERRNPRWAIGRTAARLQKPEYKQVAFLGCNSPTSPPFTYFQNCLPSLPFQTQRWSLHLLGCPSEVCPAAKKSLPSESPCPWGTAPFCHQYCALLLKVQYPECCSFFWYTWRILLWVNLSTFICLLATQHLVLPDTILSTF